MAPVSRLRSLDAFRVFDAIFVLTDGGPGNTTESLSLYAYKTLLRGMLDLTDNLRGDDVIFYRNRAEGSDESLADLVHQTAMYYEDRLGGTAAGFKRVMLAGTGPLEGRGLESVRREIEGRLGVRTESVAADRIARFTDRIAADPDLLGTVAPLVGLLARGRAAV